MSIPSHDDLYADVLSLVQQQGETNKHMLADHIATRFHLSDEEKTQLLPSGSNMLVSRVGWSISYLYLCGLLRRVGRGRYAISEEGIGCLNMPQDALRDLVNRRMRQRDVELARQRNSERAQEPAETPEAEPQTQTKTTPTEHLHHAYMQLRREICDEILHMVYEKTPQAFEQIVVALLQKMGYGGAVEKSGKATRYSRDGGIDGEIKEDILGFGRIHIQAKLYEPSRKVGRPEVQAFVGALQGENGSKGVFITTAGFSKEARDYADNLAAAKVVLIDGSALADYIYRFDLGMQTEQLLAVKSPDTDFWDSYESKK